MALTQQFTSGMDLSAAVLNASSIPVVSATSDIVSPFTGQIVFNTTTGLLHKYSGVSWAVFHPSTQWLSKGTAESVTSSTALQNDDTFAFSVAANASYALEGYVLFTAAAAGDLNADFTVPAGSSFEWTNFATPGTAALTSYNVVAQGASVARVIDGNDATVMTFAPRGWLGTAGTAGTLQFRWTQGTSSATATTVRVGSWMKLTRIG
jgi:hypothetical protein